jgi:hypothetical protein
MEILYIYCLKLQQISISSLRLEDFLVPEGALQEGLHFHVLELKLFFFIRELPGIELVCYCNSLTLSCVFFGMTWNSLAIPVGDGEVEMGDGVGLFLGILLQEQFIQLQPGMGQLRPEPHLRANPGGFQIVFAGLIISFQQGCRPAHVAEDAGGEANK